MHIDNQTTYDRIIYRSFSAKAGDWICYVSSALSVFCSKVGRIFELTWQWGVVGGVGRQWPGQACNYYSVSAS